MITIIPAIDVIDGKCVRLTQGDYARKKIYNEHPLEVAKQFEDLGIRRLHLVDLDGAKKGTVVNWKVLETIAGKTNLEVDFGGGIKTDEDIQIVFSSGAVIATIGSIAVKDPPVFYAWLQRYGGKKILLGADVKDEKIVISGWQEQTQLSIFDFIRQHKERGVQQLFCTDVSKDGLLEGPSVNLYENIISAFPGLHLIASGGVSNVSDVLALEAIGCSGVIIGKAIYEGLIKLTDLKSLI